MEIVNTMRDLLHLNPLYGEQFRTLLSLSEWQGSCFGMKQKSGVVEDC